MYNENKGVTPYIANKGEEINAVNNKLFLI